MNSNNDSPAQHTATPWESHDYGHNTYVRTVAENKYGEHEPICMTLSEDAAFIVRACNSHAALVELLERSLTGMTAAERRTWEIQVRATLRAVKEGA